MTAVWVALMVPGYLVLGSVAVRVTDQMLGEVEADGSRWLLALSIVFWPVWVVCLLVFAVAWWVGLLVMAFGRLLVNIAGMGGDRADA